MSMYGKFRDAVDTGPGLTKQSFADEVNINKIIARFEKSGMVTHLNKKNPFYGDVSGIVGYQEALNKVKEAQELFMGMSPAIRERFENNPDKMIMFLNDKKNLEEAIKLGMVVPKPVEGKDGDAKVKGVTP